MIAHLQLAAPTFYKNLLNKLPNLKITKKYLNVFKK